MKKNIEDVYPLTPLQEGIFFHSLLNRRDYVEQASFRITGSININYLEKTFQLLVERHAILRTAFIYEDVDRPFQVVHKKRPLDFFFQDLSGKQDDAESLLNEYREKDLQRGFLFEQDPLVRLAAFKLDSTTHELVWTYHHILLDGWSGARLVKEFFDIYMRCLLSEQITLDTTPSFSTYVQWLQKQNKDEAKGYWSNYLKEYSGTVPIDLRSVSTRDYSHKAKIVTLSPHECDFFTGAAAEYNLTINHVFHAIWAILLSKYARKDDIVFGEVVSTRPSQLPGIESMLGLFLNTLPVRVILKGSQTLGRLAACIKNNAVESFQYNYFSLAEIQSLTGGQNLFDHIVVTENYPDASLTGQGNNKDSIPFEVVSNSKFQKTNYDLNVFLYTKKEITIKLEYNGNRFSESFVEDLLIHFRYIVAQFLRKRNLLLRNVQLLTPEEVVKIVGDSNYGVEGPSSRSLFADFHSIVKRYPYETAIIFNDRHVTYGHLFQMISRLRLLILERVKPGEIVAVYLKRSEWSVISMLAIYYSRCCYIALEKELKHSQLSSILEDAVPSLILTDTHVFGFDGFDEKLLKMTGLDFESNAGEDLLADESNFNDFNACIIFTSGSTGRPKGVVQTSRTLSNLVTWQIEESGIMHHSVVLQVCGSGFDVFLQDTFFTLCSGGCLLIVENNVKSDFHALYRFILVKKPEVASLPYSILNLFFLEFNVSELLKIRIKQIITYGEQLVLNRNLIKYLSINQSATIFNHYGPMETFIVCNYALGASLGNISDYPPIGKPISNNSIFILDEDSLVPVPAEVLGEICVAGKNLASGYLNQIEQTAEKFVNVRLLNGKFVLCYRTGDYGYRSAEGNVIFTGRKDRQVKVSGYRIELDEIEYLLGKHPDIKEAIVAIEELNNGDKRLIVFYTSSKPLTQAELREYLSNQLNVNAIPIDFQPIEAFKLNKNGKIDRDFILKLPRTEFSGFCEKLSMTGLERTLSDIWEDVLSVNNVTVSQNFFAVGGHSLKAIQVIARINKYIGKKITLRQFYANPTIKDVARLLLNSDLKHADKLTQTEEQEYYEATYSQRRIWVAEINARYNNAYNVSTEFQLDVLNKSALEKTVTAIVDENEILRTGFFERGGKIYQKIYPLNAVRFHLHYAENEDPVSDYNNHLFNLSSPCLFIIKVSRQDSSWNCAVSIHHIVCDGWSLNLLANRASKLYAQHLNNEELSYTRLPFQFKDFSAWYNALIPTLAASKEYWVSQFKTEVPALNIFKSHQSRSEAPESAVYRYLLPHDELLLLKESYNCTLFSVILTCIKVLFYRYTNQEDIVIGTPVSGRTLKESEEQIGLFINLLPLRTKIIPQHQFDELLKNVNRYLLESLEHQLYPFDLLLEDLDLKWQQHHTPLFNVLLTFENFEDKSPANAVAQDNGMHTVGSSVKFDLNFVVKLYKDRIILCLEYDASRLPRFFVERLAQHLSNIIKTVCEVPQQILTSVNYLSSAEVAQLTDFNNTYHPYPTEATLVSLFQRQVIELPDKIALAEFNTCISYKELDRLTSALASVLQDTCKVKPGCIIAVMMEPSAQMVISVMSILKAGCAYLPIDSNDPPDRLNYMLSDASPVVMLSDKADVIIQHGTGLLLVNDHFLSTLSRSNVIADYAISPSALAYVLYTSGSTGRPKGVMVEHSAVVNRIDWMWRQLRFSQSDVIIQKTPYTFDVSVWELFMTLGYGSTLVIVPGDTIYNSLHLAQAIYTHKVTAMHFVPSMLTIFLEALEHRNEDLTSLTKIIASGEPLLPQVARRCKQNINAELYNLYGPTEAAIDVTFHRVSFHDKSIPIGKPISNLEIQIHDKLGRLLPVGVEGEIMISGVGLARGYLNKPELTAEKFVTEDRTGKRIYRTGDIGRWDNYGSIEFIGRMDQQVKIGGYRVELDEIENVLREHSDVQGASILYAGNTNVKELVCFYVSNLHVESPMLVEHLAKKLPRNIIPNKFIRVEKMPLTSSGKIDKKNLEQIYANTRSGTANLVSPRTNEEAQLFEIWRQLLNTDDFGVTDNFLQLGGNSLVAMRMISQIKTAFNVEIGFRDIFQNASIAQLASVISHRKTENVEELTNA